jgi:hypothetical protein
MMGWEIALGVALGALGAALHLAVVHWRATRFSRAAASKRSTAFALWSMPLGWLGPAAGVLAAASISAVAAWSTIPGIVALRVVVLSRARRTPEPSG